MIVECSKKCFFAEKKQNTHITLNIISVHVICIRKTTILLIQQWLLWLYRHLFNLFSLFSLFLWSSPTVLWNFFRELCWEVTRDLLLDDVENLKKTKGFFQTCKRTSQKTLMSKKIVFILFTKLLFYKVYFTQHTAIFLSSKMFLL